MVAAPPLNNMLKRQMGLGMVRYWKIQISVKYHIKMVF